MKIGFGKKDHFEFQILEKASEWCVGTGLNQTYMDWSCPVHIIHLCVIYKSFIKSFITHKFTNHSSLKSPNNFPIYNLFPQRRNIASPWLLYFYFHGKCSDPPAHVHCYELSAIPFKKEFTFGHILPKNHFVDETHKRMLFLSLQS